ncbi:4-hydroxy-tetrahydrodipicolinate reductase [Jeotgalibacillus proteolyticus]|uniref:4-hydroxy-tetrahydrodipicolinate reductase n=1 Tax=Jeotgalibacillus proteolyticus TaxID=2082395 RepID=A0A2S5GDY1_9BACL|nr:4-hydroxy-tetrahydrodipicolinate reductase [Jeotgalibacillus proteolyticus]PPA71247.1 4-hydroxy-tetrahydrodipicolinate reductase [Jeotgalibacillus proteolyticus]
MNEPIKVVIAGPRGRMGREAVKLVMNTSHFKLVGAIDYKYDDTTLNEVDGFTDTHDSVKVFSNPDDCFQELLPDVLIDLTTPETGYEHTKAALLHNVRPVVGTTGFTDGQLDELKEIAESRGLGVIIAPNFAIGAVLMMKFSQMAAKYFEDVEIIEMHHDQKLDAPSGTGIKTAQMIQEVRTSKKQGHPNEKETIDGARGSDIDGMRVHSVRLPGLIAHQQVMFGGEGQLLTVRHDSHDRASFMSGVRVCVDTIMKLDTLVYGLENILD